MADDREKERSEGKVVCNICKNKERQRVGKKEYAVLNKEIKKNTRRDHRAYADRIANEAQVAADQGNQKGMFNAIRQLKNDMWPAVGPIRDKEGKPITFIEGQIHRWKKYLEEILNTSTTNMEREELTSIPTEWIRKTN